MSEAHEAHLAHKRRVFEMFGYTPTPLQWEIHSSPAQNRIVACGVRFGKSWLAAYEALAMLLIPGTKGWIVTPEHSLGKQIFSYIKRELSEKTPLLQDKRNSRVSDKDQYIVLPNGSELSVKSANNKTSLAGAKLDYVILDEAAKMDDEARDLVSLRLMDNRGWLLAISSPVGRNWFYKAYLRGQDREANAEWASWNAPSWANPFLHPDEIEERKRTFNESRFRQEVGAEFLDDEGAVFKNIQKCATVRFVEKGPDPVVGKRYAVSADLGRHQDYTAVLVWDVKQKSAIHFEFFQGSWDAQTRRIKAICKRYNTAALIVDATGEGDAVFEQLKHDNTTEHFASRVFGELLYSAKHKQRLVEALIVALEREDVSFVNHPRLIRELGEYEFTRSPKANTISYAAPSGSHDDGVMSLVLGWHLIGRLKSTAMFRMA